MTNLTDTPDSIRTLDISFETLLSVDRKSIDAIEVAPVMGSIDGSTRVPYIDATYYERVDQGSVDLISAYTVYYHIKDRGADWVADFETIDEAMHVAKVLSRIFNVPITG